MEEKDIQQQAIAVRELIRSEGWEVVMGYINAEIQARKGELSDLNIEEDPTKIGADYIRIASELNGLSRPEEIVNDILAKAEEQ